MFMSQAEELGQILPLKTKAVTFSVVFLAVRALLTVTQ
jgi:hypothetical protein